MSQQKNPHSTAKTNDKSTFLRKNVSSGISDIAIASVHSEKKTSEVLILMMKMVMMMMKSQEMTVFSGHQKLTSAMKLRPE